MNERRKTTKCKPPGQKEAQVSEEDILMIKKVHQILDAGKNVEIRTDSMGNPKVLKVSKELA